MCASIHIRNDTYDIIFVPREETLVIKIFKDNIRATSGSVNQKTFLHNYKTATYKIH